MSNIRSVSTLIGAISSLQSSQGKSSKLGFSCFLRSFSTLLLVLEFVPEVSNMEKELPSPRLLLPSIYFSIKAVARRCSTKKVFSKASLNSYRNICVGVFLIKLEAVGQQFYYKGDCSTDIFL